MPKVDKQKFDALLTRMLQAKPAPKWKVCPSCKLAFHGPDTVPENPATGHTPGDWQP